MSDMGQDVTLWVVIFVAVTSETWVELLATGLGF
jgi:hypothetical protein